MKGKCSVCGKDAEIWAIPGHFGSYSYGSCDECIIKMVEPYYYLTYGGGFAKVAVKKYPRLMPEIVVRIIRRNLDFHGKTDEEFLEDCKGNIDLYANSTNPDRKN